MGKIKEFLRKYSIKERISKEIEARDKNKATEMTNLLDELNKRRFGSWKSKFIADVYGENILYPHDEMEIAKKAYFYNAWIQAAVNSLNDFFVGGEIKISSKDKGTESYLNQKFEETGLKKIFQDFVFKDLINFGNCYSERIKQNGAIINYQYISEPENMYADLDEKQLIKIWVQRLPEEMMTARGMKFETIKYYGDRRKSIKGIPIPKEKVFHIKMGIASIPIYGRGATCTIVNDVKIMLEVERAMAVIARYKSIPKKLLQIVKANGPKDGEIIAQELNKVGDDENPIIPFELKIDDMSYAGKDLNFQPIIDYLKRKLTVCLAPSFLIHGDETTYAVSKEQRTSFELKAMSNRSTVSYQLKKELKMIARLENKAIADFDIEFGTYDIGQDDENRNAAVNLWNAGIIKLDEAREIIGLEKDKENGEFYSFELKTTPEPAGGVTVNNGGNMPEEKVDIEKETLDLNMKKKQIELMKKKEKLIKELQEDLDE